MKTYKYTKEQMINNTLGKKVYALESITISQGEIIEKLTSLALTKEALQNQKEHLNRIDEKYRFYRDSKEKTFF